MHNVKFVIPERDLGKADIEFNVKRSGVKVGTLRISKGSIVWFPKDKSYGFKIGWTKFDELMQEQKGREKRR
jgi:hypothetical protein